MKRPEPNTRSRLAQLCAGLKSGSGATAAEFALAIPVFLTLMFGIMEGGRAMFTQAVLFYASQEATRWAIVHPKTGSQTEAEYLDAIELKAIENIILISPQEAAGVTAIAPPDPTDKTREFTVTITYNYHFMMPFLGGSPIQFSASSTGFLAEEG